ncbi:MAG: DUF393 domain-containing protein [Planctomycetia bacterium]|nr:MAG: DUF393 domain-containing protein [Planctomycetia bacterium]
MSRTPPLIGTVLYDDACGFCRRWVPKWRNVLHRRGLLIGSLQSARDTLGRDVPAALWYADLRIVLRNGKQVCGADAYRFALRRIWWTLPIYLLAVTPGLRWLFDRGYRAFADGRFGVSRLCGLEGRQSGKLAGGFDADAGSSAADSLAGRASITGRCAAARPATNHSTRKG